MAKRKTSSAERYWYAVGYHHGITNIKDSPSKDTVEFLKSTIGIPVEELYEDGWTRGQKDKEEGLE